MVAWFTEHICNTLITVKTPNLNHNKSNYCLEITQIILFHSTESLLGKSLSIYLVQTNGEKKGFDPKCSIRALRLILFKSNIWVIFSNLKCVFLYTLTKTLF